MNWLGPLVQDFHTHRALAGDHIGIVVGVDESQFLLFFQLARVGQSLVVGIAVQHDFGAAAPYRLYFDLRGSGRHNDDSIATQALCCERDTLRMVAG